MSSLCPTVTAQSMWYTLLSIPLKRTTQSNHSKRRNEGLLLLCLHYVQYILYIVILTDSFLYSTFINKYTPIQLFGLFVIATKKEMCELPIIILETYCDGSV